VVFKQNLSPLSKGGQITKHKGKGSQQANMPTRTGLQSLMQPGQNTMNNYAKATPVPSASASSLGPSPTPGGPGLGSGNWAGNGM
jgi:hypothetical protein